MTKAFQKLLPGLLILALAFTLVPVQFSVKAQTALSPGDIAIIGVNADNPDDFAFVALVDIQAGTEIRFTDSGWFSSGAFRANEGAVKYTAPSAITAGTIISYIANTTDFVSDNDSGVGTSGFALSASGDQIIAFQGASNNPSLIYAVQTNSNQWQTNATASTNSALPSGLINGTTAVAVGAGSGASSEYDNAVYDMSTTSGTQAEILAAVSNNTNWNGNNSHLSMPTGAFTIGTGDAAPTISSTIPANTAGHVAIDANIDINFNEDVTVTGSWFDISCTTSGAHTATVSGGPQNFTLNPDANFAEGESCTVTITAAQVADQDGTPDNMALDYIFSFTTFAVTFIHDIQGSGSASPIVGNTVTIEGIVVGDFQDDVGANGDMNGFFVQEEDSDADANALTSEGIFVYNGSNPVVDVANGDKVRVEGSVSEYNGQTQITSYSDITVVSSGNSLLTTASPVSLPVSAVNDFEAYEGMYVTFPQALAISEFYNYDRFGEIVLTTDRQFQPTAVFEPGSVDAANLAVANSLSRITLDDGRTASNPDPAIHPNGLEFDLTNLFRGGDTATDVTGVISYSYDLYRVQPTQGANYTSVNPRTASPDPVGGNVTVASFNVLNYFTTLDNAGSICGPLSDQGCRGADNATEFTRQRDKIIAAIAEIDADVVGLIEIENHPTDAALADLVSGLNAAMGAGTYEYVATGPVGPDVIRVAFIYKPASVSPFGSHAVLDTPAFLDPNNLGDDKNRAALAQTFSYNPTGGVFTAVVNHLKSKGSPCGAGDDHPEAASCNLTRTLAAQELLNWLATDPTSSSDEDFMIIGDLNAYDKEDPIDALVAGGYSDLAYHFEGEYAYSYVFSGALGYLDYALANAALLSKVTGATEWHINADEADLIDYDTSYKKTAQDAIYAPDAYRASDHDPVVVGMELTTEAEINELIADVQKLLDDGVLNGGQANALTSKLENVLAKLAKGNTNAAANQLGAFINQVEAYVNGGILTTEQGYTLTKSAALLVGVLSN